MIEKEKIQIYNEVTDLWKKLCELHSELFELTCDEYSALLSSNLEHLEEIVNNKINLINLIKKEEKRRLEFINILNMQLPDNNKIENVTQLLRHLSLVEKEIDEIFLSKYNSLLISIIEKIRVQNKRNQLFINRSLISLKEIKDGLSGKKSFQTYNSMGISTSKTG